MKKIVCLFAALVILSGCSSVRKPIPGVANGAAIVPTETPAPTVTPSAVPTPEPTTAPTPTPEPTNTPAPTKAPTPTPTKAPEPTKRPTPTPTPKTSVPAQGSMNMAAEAAKGAETVMVNGKSMVKNPNSILVLVNKNNNLSSDYKPSMVVPNAAFPFSGDNPKKYMRKEAADALEELYSQSKKDGVKIYAVSGFRAYSTQESIFNREVKAKGGSTAEANKTVAIPGQSEHQTGLAMDMTCAAVGYGLSESFENTKEGKWLKDNAHKFGFIIRYPKGKTSITGYSYEPWHIRYVGKEAAQYIYTNNITFEEFHERISGN